MQNEGGVQKKHLLLLLSILQIKTKITQVFVSMGYVKALRIGWLILEQFVTIL